MTGEVIKSFLVGLGFGVDESSLAKFNKAIASATLRVTALYASINTAATGILYGISKISEGFEQMGYEYRIIAPAINKALVLRQELLKAYAAAGINITKVIQNSVRLNMSLAKTKFAFKAIYDSVGSRFFQLLTKNSDAFREKLYKNMPQIQNVLERLIKAVFKGVEATAELGVRLWSILTRVYDFFARLDKATDGWSTIIVGIVAAWKLLNLSFLATPLGLLLSLGAALLALYDDYQTFQEGGKSLFDWSSAIPTIQAIERLINSLTETLSNLFQVVFAIGDAFWKLLSLDFSGFWTAVKLGAESVWEVFRKLGDSIKDILSLGGALGGWAAHLFGNNPSNAASNAHAAASPVPNPVSPMTQNSQTNQSVKQQTTISVSGSTDASSIGRAVAGEQNRVNSDLVRNMKGATR